MKKGVIIVEVILVSLMLAGCPGLLPEPVSIEERITLFEKDLNDGKDLQGHFHPDLSDEALSKI